MNRFFGWCALFNKTPNNYCEVLGSCLVGCTSSSKIHIYDVTLEDSTNFSQVLYIWSWQAEAQADLVWIREIVVIFATPNFPSSFFLFVSCLGWQEITGGYLLVWAGDFLSTRNLCCPAGKSTIESLEIRAELMRLLSKSQNDALWNLTWHQKVANIPRCRWLMVLSN